MSNLYWVIYKNLEREVLHFGDLIHFDDNQLSVYSIRISDLLLRCAVEIEAISKELYAKNGGEAIVYDDAGNSRNLYFDTDCLNYLETKWKLSKKQVFISSTNAYFEQEDNKVLTPLKDANRRSKCNWKKAYQSIKHDRGKELERGNIKNLLHAMAALFILNIYYKNEEEISVGKTKVLADLSFGSEIFSIYTNVRMPTQDGSEAVQNEDDEKSIYIIKIAESLYVKYLEQIKRAHMQKINVMQTIIGDKYTVAEKEDMDGNIIEFLYDTDFIELARKEDIDSGNLTKLITNIAEIDKKPATFLADQGYEAVLNKNQIIYCGIH